MILTHYFPPLQQGEYISKRNLFTTITEYNDSEQTNLAKHLSHYPGRALHRFELFDDYINRRCQTEIWLYYSFLHIGGKPKSPHPFYFVLGKSKQLKKDFGKGAMELILDTEQIDSQSISFTLGDSIGVYFSTALKRIYSLEEITVISSNKDFIQEQMVPLNVYHHYVEAQLWDKQYLENATISIDYPLETFFFNSLLVFPLDFKSCSAKMEISATYFLINDQVDQVDFGYNILYNFIYKFCYRW